MHVALVQFDITWQEKAENHRRIETMLDDAQVPPGAIIVLPELGDTGFSFDLDRIIDDRTLAWGSEVARERGVWLQVGYAVRGEDGMGRNCATLLAPDGTSAGTYQKVHPFSYGRESEFYGGGDTVVVRRCEDAVVSPMICYDLRFPELWRCAVRAGAELFTIGASWPDARQAHWRALAIARAIENQAFVAAVNRIGRDPFASYAGGSIVIGPRGEVLAEAGCDPVVLQADLDLEAVRTWRQEFPALADVRPELLGRFPVDVDATP